ncbi:MAG: hypothetical protein M0P43_10750 [Arcobacteraceae bacterium]|nr:hypothetical protein [Arcobacteraceae bacterium]
MFVLKSKYKRLLSKHELLISEYTKLSREYHDLVTRWERMSELLEEKGVIEFIENIRKNQIFSKEEIKVLISLCHPDKHENSKKAEEITKKLLSMR